MVALSSPNYTYQQSNLATEKNVYVSCKGDRASLGHELGLIGARGVMDEFRCGASPSQIG